MLEKIIYPFAYALGWIKRWASHFQCVCRICMKLRRNEKVIENLKFNQAVDLISIIELRFVDSMYRRDVAFYNRKIFEAWYDVWGDRLINEYSEYLEARGS